MQFGKEAGSSVAATAHQLHSYGQKNPHGLARLGSKCESNWNFDEISQIVII